MLRRHLLLLALAHEVGALAQTQPSQDQPSLLIVSSDSAQPYADVARQITEQLVNAGLAPNAIKKITTAGLASALWTGQGPQPKLIVALGVDAASALAKSEGRVPVLAALVPRSSWQDLLSASGRRQSSQFTALYLDQPLSRQLGLIRLALPTARRIGVLLGPESSSRLGLLKSLAASHGLTVTGARVDAEAGVFSALKQVLDNSDVLLALADPQVFNSQSIQNILLAAFRAKVPMVGFSPAYVRAGALLSLHVTPAQAAVQAVAMVQAALSGDALPTPPTESNDFEVGVNVHVARAMNLSLNPQALRQALRDAEHLP